MAETWYCYHAVPLYVLIVSRAYQSRQQSTAHLLVW